MQVAPPLAHTCSQQQLTLWPPAACVKTRLVIVPSVTKGSVRQLFRCLKRRRPRAQYSPTTYSQAQTLFVQNPRCGRNPKKHSTPPFFKKKEKKILVFFFEPYFSSFSYFYVFPFHFIFFAIKFSDLLPLFH